MQEALQQNGLAKGVQVVNIPGAGGTIGLAQLVTAKKPGASLITIGVTTVGAILTNKPAITLDDAHPLALLLREYSLVVVPANSDVKTRGRSRRQGEGGSCDRPLGRRLGRRSRPRHRGPIHEGGRAPTPASSTRSTIRGAASRSPRSWAAVVTVGVGGVPELASQIKSGKIRALAVSSAERLPGLDVPTLKEQGVDVAIGTWRGLMARKQATDAEKKELSAAIEKMVATPSLEEHARTIRLDRRLSRLRTDSARS